MKEGRLRQTYPAAGPVFHYRVEEPESGATVSVDGIAAGLEIVADTNAVGEVQRGWIRAANGNRPAFAAGWIGDSLHLWLDGQQYVFERVTAQSVARPVAAPEGDALAPMPGTVAQVLVTAGQRVEAGETLAVMESMKMELVIASPRAGVVKRVAVAEGDQVDRGMRLVELEE